MVLLLKKYYDLIFDILSLLISTMLEQPQFKEEQRQKVVVLQPQLPTRPPVQIKLPTEPDKGVAEMLHKKRQRKSESNNNNNEGEGEATTSFSTPMSRPPSLQILLQVSTTYKITLF